MNFDLPRGWSLKTLSDCCTETISYGIVQPGTHYEDGVSVIRVNNFKKDGLELSDVLKVTQAVSDKYKRTVLKGGEVLLTLVGSTGQSVVVPKSMAGWNVPRAIAVLRVSDDVGAEWVNCCLQSPITKHFLDARANTTVQKTLNLKDVKDIPIPVPPKDYKEQALSTLVSLSQKLDTNRNINHTLEEIAQAIFKSWFVDFDPVKAKMNGEQPEGMDAATASLFPEKLVESELGLIPEGWEAGSIGSVTTAKGGYAFKSKQFIETGNPVIKIKNITSSGTVNSLDCQCIDDDIARAAPRFKLSNGDLLMAMTGATVGKSGIYVSDGRDGYLNQRVARFESKVDSSNPCWFTYNLVTKDNVFEQIVGAAQGSAQPNISSKGIEQVKAVIPTHDLIGKYQEVVAPLYAKWISNFKENSQLAELRDTLLPKLLSGEIDLDNVLDV
ncbi:type I restriction enzyme, S subunit [Vibrio crassostreae]|nr:type I restriction enzyme, S subunit [Vibrio crassostreae]CAK3854455.1 type I restriction enzyme, S subunit [Vibrio crassostreae]